MVFYVSIAWCLMAVLVYRSASRAQDVDELMKEKEWLFTRKFMSIILVLITIIGAPYFFLFAVIPSYYLDIKKFIIFWRLRRKVNKILKKGGSKKRVNNANQIQ